MNWSDYPDFPKSEFDCKHTGLNEMKPEFMSKLQELRKRYGRPLKITSGYRHPTHPIEARKGSKTGEHTFGTCADVSCTSGSDRFELIRLALEVGFTRIGIAKTFVHLGIGHETLPKNVIWDY